MSTIQPVNDHLVIQRIDREKTAGGILIPETATRPAEARVIAVGPGRRDANGNRNPMDIAAGDHIFYEKNTGHPLEIDGEKYLAILECNVLVVVKS